MNADGEKQNDGKACRDSASICVYPCSSVVRFLFPTHHVDTSYTPRGLGVICSKKVRVWSRSNFGSRDSTARKNLSRLANPNAGTLNSGGSGCGRRFSASMPNTAISAAPSTVISNLIGTHAGQLFSGRPPTFHG